MTGSPGRVGGDARGQPLLEAVGVSRRFGGVTALEEASLAIHPGEVTCLLGDNGAGKSTLVRILSGVDRPSSGELRMGGERVRFASPRAALERGVATVHQDLGMVPLMSVWRNFVLGIEPTLGRGLFRRLDVERARRAANEGLAAVGIELDDVERAVATLSGGERQAVAIARAVSRGARVLILDEPTAALGVRQTDIVLGRIARARDHGVGIVFVTHNPRQAYPAGDRFVILRHGRPAGTFARDEVTVEDLTRRMSG